MEPVGDDSESMWAVARALAESGDHAGVPSIEAELRRRGFSEVERLAEMGVERDLLTRTCIAARERLAAERNPQAAAKPTGTSPAMSERDARRALRRLGYRLSQRNGGYMILDVEQNYVPACLQDGKPREISLRQVAEWIESIGASA